MFERISPEAAGISSAAVKGYIEALDRRGMKMHGVLMIKGNSIFSESYWAPFNSASTHRMYSQTKSFVAVAVGLCLEEGLLSLDDKIADYFEGRFDRPLPRFLKEQTIREMLTMTTSGESNYWFTEPDEGKYDRTRLYFETMNDAYPANTEWKYDSPGSQVLCSLVEKLTGKKLLEYLKEKLFDRMDCFHTAETLSIANGDTWGDSAMICTLRDVASLGRLLLSGGVWQGEKLIDRSYVEEATSKRVANAENVNFAPFSYGYGYQIWRTEAGGFAFVGMGDQLTVCLPEKDIVFSCIADNQGNPFSRHYIISEFFDRIVYPMAKEPLAPCDADYRALVEVENSRTLFALRGLSDSPMREAINGVDYEVDGNPMGLRSFRFDFDGKERGVLTYVNEGGEMSLPFGVNSNEFGLFPELGYSDSVGGARTTDGFRYRDAVSFAWLDESRVMLYVQIIDRYFGNATLRFSFRGDYAAVAFSKTAEDFLWNYSGEALAHRRHS